MHASLHEIRDSIVETLVRTRSFMLMSGTNPTNVPQIGTETLQRKAYLISFLTDTSPQDTIAEDDIFWEVKVCK